MLRLDGGGRLRYAWNTCLFSIIKNFLLSLSPDVTSRILDIQNVTKEFKPLTFALFAFSPQG